MHNENHNTGRLAILTIWLMPSMPYPFIYRTRISDKCGRDWEAISDQSSKKKSSSIFFR
jgi:hypothetical protein